MKKEAFFQWKTNGRPIDPRNAYFIQKKDLTYNLRKHCRKAIVMSRVNDREQILETNIENKNLFYKLIKKQRGKLSNHIDELNVDGIIYSAEDNILNGWKRHFEKQTCNSQHEHLDKKYPKNRGARVY